MQGNVALLEDGSDCYAERLAAVVALVDAGSGALAVELADPVQTSATRTYRTARPKDCFHELVSFGFIVEVRMG